MDLLRHAVALEPLEATAGQRKLKLMLLTAIAVVYLAVLPVSTVHAINAGDFEAPHSLSSERQR